MLLFYKMGAVFSPFSKCLPSWLPELLPSCPWGLDVLSQGPWERARVREGHWDRDHSSGTRDSPTPILDWLYLGLGRAGSGMHGGEKRPLRFQWPLTTTNALMSVSAEVQVQDYSAKLGTSIPKRKKGPRRHQRKTAYPCQKQSLHFTGHKQVCFGFLPRFNMSLSWNLKEKMSFPAVILTKPKLSFYTLGRG